MLVYILYFSFVRFMLLSINEIFHDYRLGIMTAYPTTYLGTIYPSSYNYSQPQ